MDALAKVCGICGGDIDRSIAATERMFGLGGEFWYDQCAECGCVQLRDVPADLARYYATDAYYAFAEPPEPSLVRRLYRRVRDALLFGRARSIGALVVGFLPARIVEVREWLTITRASRRSRILDVGCGAGLLLQRLVDEKYEQVLGVDPFIDSDISYRGRPLVQKGTIHDVSGEFDLIMFHHALEHITDQAAVMARAAELLAPGGWCLIRIPTVSSLAWEEYQDRWVQLDAPRHLYIHSVESLARLSRDAGLVLERVVFDSTTFQFEGSELYRRDIPLKQLNGSSFTRAERRAFAQRASRLNAMNRGDQAAFYLRKEPSRL